MKNHGAGFLLGKIFPNGEIKFLGLIAPVEKRIKRNGIYDIPKGKINPGETILDCAKRECKEESGIFIDDNQIIGHPYVDNGLWIYSAIISQEPCISPNPTTGIIEHEGYKWLTKDEILMFSLDYLRNLISNSLKHF